MMFLLKRVLCISLLLFGTLLGPLSGSVHAARTTVTAFSPATEAARAVLTQRAPSSCQANDYVAICIEPSVLRVSADLGNGVVSEGTGFVIQSDSTGTYVLTNLHVLAGATTVSQLSVTSPGGSVSYPVVAAVRNNAPEGTPGDLAVVQLQPTGLQALTWDDSSQLVTLEQVFSIGYPNGSDLQGPPTVTQGVISAVGRDLGDGYGPIWIQHQSFINPGNSGGPLLDANYAVVGVNTKYEVQTQGIFFAIPSDYAVQIAQGLISQLQTP